MALQLSTFTGIILVFISIVYIYFKKSFHYWKNLGVPQLNPSFPFGDMASVIFRKQNMADKIKQIYDQHKGKPYVGLYFFSRKAFLPLDPLLIKNILCKDFHHFHDRGIHYDEVNDPLSAHLFSLAGTKWKNLRAKLTPAYSPNKIKYMFNIIKDCGIQMQEILIETAKNSPSIEMKEIFARYSTDVIGSCAFGLECNSLKNPNAEFRLMGKRAFTQTVTDVLKMIVIRSFPKLANLLGFGVFAKNVTEFFQRAVKETISFREENNLIRNDFMQLLIHLKHNKDISDDGLKKEAGTALTADEAAAQAFIFFLAGFETTSTTISFALFEMASNLEIQTKARQEIQDCLQKFDDELSYEAIMELNYLDMIILETMRKYPPAPIFLRKCTKKYKIPETEVYIEEGLSVLIPAFGLHKDPEYYPNPEKFDPERFSNENKSKIKDYTYIPFGDGPRICIGMRFAMVQIKIALALILSTFNFRLSPKTKLPLKMESKGIILAPIGGIWIELEKLN